MVVNSELYLALESAGAKEEYAARAAHTLAKLELAMMPLTLPGRKEKDEDGKSWTRFVPVRREISILRLLVFLNLVLTVLLMFKVLS